MKWLVSENTYNVHAHTLATISSIQLFTFNSHHPSHTHTHTSACVGMRRNERTTVENHCENVNQLSCEHQTHKRYTYIRVRIWAIAHCCIKTPANRLHSYTHATHNEHPIIVVADNRSCCCCLPLSLPYWCWCAMFAVILCGCNI